MQIVCVRRAQVALITQWANERSLNAGGRRPCFSANFTRRAQDKTAWSHPLEIHSLFGTSEKIA
jgi:hypothetical protein